MTTATLTGDPFRSKFSDHVGHVRSARAGNYGIDYTVNVYDCPAFADFDRGTLARWLRLTQRADPNGDVTMGGSPTWRPEELLALLHNSIGMIGSWKRALGQDNFITQSLGVKAVEYSTDLFAYNPATKTFSAEASTLGLQAGRRPAWLRLRSARTGKVVEFNFHAEICDGEGEITEWVYGAAEVKGCTVRLFND